MTAKARLTITLSQNILREVDQTIDGQDIRNRSHAIEHLISQSLTPTIQTAVILAGGPARQKSSPSLTSINRRPLILVMVDHLKSFGITNFVICANSQLNQIKKTLGKGKKLGINIKFVNDELSGTAGAVKKVKKFINHEPFLVLYADILTNIDVKAFIFFHQHENALATMAVKPRIGEKEYGKVLLQGNRITEFAGREKDRGISIVNTGVYLFEPEIFDLIPAKSPAFFGQDVFPKLIENNQLAAFLFQGVWFDISKPKNYHQAIKRWNSSLKGG